METEKNNPPSQDGKKQKNANHPHRGKDENSPRGKGSKPVPNYDREIKMFRLETLNNIKEFRRARREWIEKEGFLNVVGEVDSKTMYDMVIDKRRVALMKKLGLKVSMMRQHRMTLRPRRYFTMKRELSVSDIDKEIEDLEKLSRKKPKDSKVIKTFRKKAKSITTKLAKFEKENQKKVRVVSGVITEAGVDGDQEYEDIELKAESQYKRLKSKADFDQLKKIGLSTYQRTRAVQFDEFSGQYKQKKRLSKTEKRSDKAENIEEIEKGEEAELDVEPPMTLSEVAFQALLKDLESELEENKLELTEADKEGLKEIWDGYRSAAKIKVKEGPPVLRVLKKAYRKSLSRCCETLMKRMERRKKKWPSEAKPCTCPVLEGEGIVLIKNVCKCSQSAGEKFVLVEKGAKTVDASVAAPSESGEVTAPIPSGSIVDRVVDSLEVLRRKVSLKSSQILKGSAAQEEKQRVNGLEEKAAKTSKDIDDKIREIYRRDKEVGSTSDAKERYSGSRAVESRKTAPPADVSYTPRPSASGGPWWHPGKRSVAGKNVRESGRNLGLGPTFKPPPIILKEKKVREEQKQTHVRFDPATTAGSEDHIKVLPDVKQRRIKTVMSVVDIVRNRIKNQ